MKEIIMIIIITSMMMKMMMTLTKLNILQKAEAELEAADPPPLLVLLNIICIITITIIIIIIIIIIILTIIMIIVSVAIIIVLQSSSLKGGSVWGRDAPVAWFRGKWISVGERKIEKRGRKGLELLKNMSSSPSSSSAFISAQSPLCWNRALGDWPSRLRLFLRSVSKVAGCSLDLCITMRMTMVSLFDILAIIVVVGLLQDD